MPELYSIIDIFVLPSYREGFPRSIIEASAMAKPIIATNVRGCHEAVDDRNNGILVPVKDSKKLADAILCLLKNPEQSLKMGLKGRERAEKEFNELSICQRVMREYNTLLTYEGLLNWWKTM